MTKKILLITEDESFFEYLKGLIKGHQIDIASSKKQAIDRIASEIYTIILLDFDIEGGGIELIKVIRSLNDEVRIIVISKSIRIEEASLLFRYDIDDLILMPVKDDLVITESIKNSEEKYRFMKEQEHLISSLKDTIKYYERQRK